ncbi:MAG: plasmid pRiA4b ORF-3 family protein [Oscillospiraceae bacterium]|nr:plasmid pRiA4b ORF-3 family protein [Oscillospiraceae bacterium]
MTRSLAGAPIFSRSTAERQSAVVNDASRYGFVLYGLTAKNREELDSLILQGIRACLEAEHIDLALIDRYMVDGGEAISYSKTANRSFVARLNKFCERAEWFAEDIRSEKVLQRKLLVRLNDDYLTTERKHCTPYDLLAEGLSKHYGVEAPYRCRAGVFDITLQLETPCYRRIVIPMDCSFSQFHIALQTLFCWQNYHLHDFWLETYPNGRLKDILVGSPREDEYEGETTCPDSDVLLSEVFPERKKIIYNYDFGDNWIHEIELVEIVEDYQYNYPQCLAATGDAPPEDVGGPGGYAELLRVLVDPEDPEHEHLKQWADGMQWMPFDMEKTNCKLKYCLRHGGVW